MVSGIIAEFNIFHNGHKYLLDSAHEVSDAVVCVMSGSFVQRGDVAFTDKWSRARTALMCGADLVLELPVCYALSAAQNFAVGGVNTLGALGIVDTLVFGSECGDIDTLTSTANLCLEENDELKEHISEGMSYPAAFGKHYGDIFSSPNNILAVEYIKAINKYHANIKPITFKRHASSHDSNELTNGFASASKIRDMLINNEDVSELIPYPASDIGEYPYLISRLDSAIISKLRTMSSLELSEISEVCEGLENRILRSAADCDGFLSLCESVKSKRYTMSKLRRIILASLIDYKKDIFSPTPEYIRVLGMTKRGAQLLKDAKQSCSVPIITKTADYKDCGEMFKLDLRATDIAALCAPSLRSRKGGTDYTCSPVCMF